MIRVLAALVVLMLVSGIARAEDFKDTMRRCWAHAASENSVPAEALLLIYLNEGGSIGQTSANSNGTFDIGPFQINNTWLPKLAEHWGLPQATAYNLVLTQFCANIEAAAWILKLCLDDAKGNLWQAVGFYHSHNPEYQARYLRHIYEHIQALLDKRRNG